MKTIDLSEKVIGTDGEVLKIQISQDEFKTHTLADLLANFIYMNKSVNVSPVKVFQWIVNIPKEKKLECDDADFATILQIVESSMAYETLGKNDFFKGQLLMRLKE